MKNILILGIALITSIFARAQKDCNGAFNAANYSVAHTGNAYDANNIKHTQEWAYKAMETLSEVERITDECGCEEASNLAYESYEAASKAQEQNTWERSRFYAKRANEKAKLMMDALTIYNENYLVKSKKSGLESRQYVSNDENLDTYYTSEDAELDAKKAVKLNAEAALAQINKGYQSLANALGCKHAYKMAKNSYLLTKDQLKSNNLTDTKLHYTLQLNDISEKAMLNFADCANNL